MSKFIKVTGVTGTIHNINVNHIIQFFQNEREYCVEVSTGNKSFVKRITPDSYDHLSNSLHSTFKGQ